MATLQIIKSTQGYFTFILDGDETKSVVDNSPKLTIYNQGLLCHFKTDNGASLFKNQNIAVTDITYTDIANNDFTFTTVSQLMTKLIAEEFFKGLNQGSGSGATRFDALLDTFTYIGNGGKVPVVNASALKLEPEDFHNVKDFLDLDDVEVAELIEGKILSVANIGGINKIVLIDAPDTTEQLVNAFGYFDFNDLGTSTTPLTLVTNVDRLLTNDTLGVFTNTTQRPYGVPSVWNVETNGFDFQYCTIGDVITVRFDITVTTTTANQRVKSFLRLVEGSSGQYDLLFLDTTYKTAGTYNIIRSLTFYLGDQNYLDYPSKFYVNTDAAGTCVVNGWFVSLLRKSVNIVTFNVENDDTADHYKGLWNASTNTPTLNNGIGQVGDYYTVSVAGNGYYVNDVVAYDGSVWYKLINNNQLLNAVQKQRIFQFLPSISLSVVNTWRGWTRNTSNMLTADANANYGTGSEPTKTGTWFADNNVFLLKDLQKLSKLTFMIRERLATLTLQLYVVVADYSDSRGSEPNGQIIINESFSFTGSGSYLKDNFTIASHTLNTNSVMYVFIRSTSGTTTLQGCEFVWEFDKV
jgi:hypothetical protein